MFFFYRNGWHFVTYTCEPTRFLPWLTNKFLALGGELKRRTIRDLGELIDDGYEIVINCSGLGARELVNDDTVTAVRGQVSRVTTFLIHTMNFIYIYLYFFPSLILFLIM